MKEDKNTPLDLEVLTEGMGGLTPAMGEVMAECASVCLEERGHRSGILLRVSGAFAFSCRLRWPNTTEQMRRCHNDREVATENGAYGIAILLVRKETGYKALERSMKGGGFDYWVGKDAALPFQYKARLEVSGIRLGDERDLSAKVREKVEQTRKSDGKFPAYVVVVEFGSPKASVVKR
ncbi:MAG: hypothetical protein NTZ09_11730 [Candidatus Hydrogenedentes bacterium]|nr:hypothetical protein [Candidatus Hydrogenedentota bacterium]